MLFLCSAPALLFPFWNECSMKARLFPLWFHLLMGPKGLEAVPGTWWVLINI